MITQIRFKNCQSWDDITINLSCDRLNVLVAENDTGKSVFFKLIKIVGSPNYYSREDRKRLIRWGCDYAMVAMAFDSGNIAIVSIKPNQVVYEYIKEDRQRVPVLQPPEEMLREAGILVGKNGDFIANVIDSDQDLLLVNSNLASNFELIRLIVMNEDLDRLQERLQNLADEFSGYYLRAADKRAFLDSQIKQIKHYDVAAMERRLNMQQMLYNSIRKMKDLESSVWSIDNAQWKDFAKLETFLNKLERLDEILFRVNEIEIRREPANEFFAEAISRLDDIRVKLKDVSISGRDANPAYASVLERLSCLLRDTEKLRLKRKDFIREEKFLYSAELLSSVGEQLRALASSLLTARRSAYDIDHLTEEFKKCGTILDCPVYGKVVYDGKECVADS